MRLLSGALIALFLGCDSPSEPDDRWAVPEEIEFAASLGIDLAAMNKTESGLYWEDIEPGNEDTRAVVLEDEVRFHYTIWLPDGTSVETTRGGSPHQREVLLLIPGVAEGITGMRRDGIRRLVIRPELAWPNGYGSIPPITTIVFEIELVAIVGS
jgi:FKBP-type peptidyl-prolyl cis-trans isomerase FkpA